MNKELLGNFIKVENISNVKGRAVPNQHIIQTDKGIVFQSYSSIIAAKVGGKVYLDENKWDYSTTTGRYRNVFLREVIS